MVEPVPETENVAAEIPDKLYFRIGEVSRLTGLKQHVLRYWETEFPALAPKKKGTSHRLYRRKDVELLLEIKRLLYDKRFTIEGARKWLESKQAPTGKASPAGNKRELQAELFPAAAPPALDKIRRELQDILRLLK